MIHFLSLISSLAFHTLILKQRSGNFRGDVLILAFRKESSMISCSQRLVILDHSDNSFAPLSEDIHTGTFIRQMRERGIPCIQPEPLKTIDTKEIR